MTAYVRLDLHGRRVKGIADGAAAGALGAGAEHLLSESRELVPLEEGTLSRSGAVTVDRSALQAAVSYDTPYAARQHEELTWRHDPGRSAKYLEIPLTAGADDILAIMAARMRRELGGG